MTDIVRNEVLRGLTAAATLMLAMGRAAIVEDNNATECENYVGGLQRDLPTVLDIAVADKTGTVYCHSGVSTTADLQTSIDILVDSESPEIIVGNYTATPGGATLPLGVALRSQEGEVEGYIQLHVSMAELVRLVTAATASLDTSTTIVSDRNGTVLLSLSEGQVEPGDPVPEPYDGLVEKSTSGAVRLSNSQGVAQIVGYRPASEDIPIATVFALPEEPMMAPIDRAAFTNSVIAFAGAALAFLLAWFIGLAFIQRPVRILNHTLSARKAGDQGARTGLGRDRSELGMIARSMDELFDELDHRNELQQRTEEQRDLYAREVQHRVKNLLAIIQVIAKQSLARPDASSEVRVFENRISAIIQTNTKLLAQSERAGLVEDLVLDAITPFVGTNSDRIKVAGPDVNLRAKVASALAMALHELATNAVKYGALSTPQGRIQVRWRVIEGRFEMRWEERGGPATDAPSQPGFGSVLISRVLQAETRGVVSTDYEHEGFSFRLVASLKDLQPVQDHPAVLV
ncbi:sensor histidine kinase [Pelagibacterium luteolum]|nr:HWE histidine kinase domain-containing protein [Pelagibacterium luteolum]